MDPLSVPTLLIGLTNKPSLIDPALMRPGRFEVKVEVPKPKVSVYIHKFAYSLTKKYLDPTLLHQQTVEQRASILKVHMESMHKSGRVLVQDAPVDSAAWRMLQRIDQDELLSLPSYDELIDLMAVECDGMSGASLAGVARAAASRALERAVTDFAGHIISATDTEGEVQNSINDCLVTQEDFERACDDVFESAKAEDYEEEDGSKSSAKEEDQDEMTDNPNDGDVVTVSSESATDSDIVEQSSMDKPHLKRTNLSGTKSVNEEKVLTELNAGYAEVSEHESITEYFRAGVEIPADWTSGRFDRKSSSRGGSLRDLLPERKTRWLKLDQFGRRVEDTDANKQ